MDKLKSYILKTFNKSFLALFIPFYAIISLTYLMNISRLSSRVSLDAGDFFTFYAYVIPDIIFITLPLTFLGAIINSFSKLSENNEMVALFTLGFSPKKILLSLLPLALLFTLLLLIITVFIIPYSNQAMSNLRSKKIYESNLKILPKKLNQDFGKHHIFIEANNNGQFKNVTMFTQKEKGNFQILISKNGSVINTPNAPGFLNLNKGLIYQTKTDGLQIIDFENMKLFNNAKYYSSKISSAYNYWLTHKQKFYYYLLISLTPLLLVALFLSFGIYNPRYQKNRSSLYILLSILIIYIPAILARKEAGPYLTIGVVFLWILLSLAIYNRKILKRY